MAHRYNSPPNWPAPPQGWTPPHGWQPDPAWGPPPEGWQLWTDDAPGPAPRTSMPAGAKRWLWPAVVVLALFVGIGIGAAGAGGDDNATTTTTQPTADEAQPPAPTVTVTEEHEVAGPETTKTVTAEPPKPKGSISGDGIWLVGTDIRPGTYRGGGGGCYYARLSGLSGELNDVIANGNPSGPVVVTIARSDKAFQTQGCGEWERIG